MTLTEFPLPEESPDRGFTDEDGVKFRARVRQVHRSRATMAPAAAAPSKHHLLITLALLEEDNSVAAVGSGFRISDPIEITLSDEQMTADAFDAEAIIMNRIEALASQMVRTIAKRKEAQQALDAWGIDLNTPAATEQLGEADSDIGMEE